MKSTARHVGSINLRGKKSLRLRCGCCWAYNHRDRERAKEAKREIIRQWLADRAGE